MLKQGATPASQLQACFHAYVTEQRLAAEAADQLEVSAIVRSIAEAHVDATAAWPGFLATLEGLGWKSTACVLHADEWRLLPPGPTDGFGGGAAAPLVRLTQSRPKGGGETMSESYRLAGSDQHAPTLRRGVMLEPATPTDESEDAGGGSWMAPVYNILLPAGFPESVAPEYMQYQLWDTLQVMMADLRSILISNAGLIGQGVGIDGATPLQTLWVDFRVEFFSTVEGLIMGGVANAGASAATMKRWRVYKTWLSYFDTTCTLMQGMFPQQRIYARCAQVGVANLINPFAGGADQALVLHLSNGSQDPAFRADVAAKESNQDRALGLVLMAVRFGLLLWVGTDWHRAWVVVAVLSVGHIALNYMAARILVLKTLNYDRFDTAFDSWCGRKQAEGSSAELLSPKTIAAQESVLPKLRKPWATPEVRATSCRNLSMPTPFKCTRLLN